MVFTLALFTMLPAFNLNIEFEEVNSNGSAEVSRALKNAYEYGAYALRNITHKVDTPPL